MPPLDEMLFKAGQGALVDAIARQFDLSRDQTIAAIEALLPAFTKGLGRATASPEGQADLLRALASGDHAAYFKDMARLFSPGGKAEGEAILGHLFGSPEISRAVADQAAAATRIRAEVLERMLPALAALVMASLAQQTVAPARRPGGGTRGEPAEPPVGGLLGGDLIGAMLKSWSAFAETGKEPETGEGRERGKDEPPPPNPFADLIETGRRMQEDYLRGMEAIFERRGDREPPSQ